MLIKFSSNEDEKKALQQVINSMICGGSLAETVCCDIAEGRNSLFSPLGWGGFKFEN